MADRTVFSPSSGFSQGALDAVVGRLREYLAGDAEALYFLSSDGFFNSRLTLLYEWSRIRESPHSAYHRIVSPAFDDDALTARRDCVISRLYFGDGGDTLPDTWCVSPREWRTARL